MKSMISIFSSIMAPLLMTLGMIVFLSDRGNSGALADVEDNIEERIKEDKANVAMINKNNPLWKAVAHRHLGKMTKAQRARLAGVRIEKYKNIRSKRHNQQSKRDVSGSHQRVPRQAVPCAPDDFVYNDEFDVRTQWPNCTNVFNSIEDQATCGSCWAVGVATVFTDRMCIQRWVQNNNFVSDPNNASNWFSELDVLSCSPGSHGCKGGNPEYAWQWIVANGVTTGSNYTMNLGCKPYPFPPMSLDDKQNSNGSYPSPQCSTTCTNTAYGSSLDRYNGQAKGYKFLEWPQLTVTAIQKELKANGSIAMIFEVYRDFYYYSRGIYQYMWGDYVGMHNCRVVGWGTATCGNTSTPYWIVANSWNNWWGMNGWFRIVRGADECGIEYYGANFGFPKVK